MKVKYKASLNRSQGRKAWCIIFQHPVLRTSMGKQGKRIRRGLGTSDENEAKKLVDQMNSLLSNDSYWDISSKERASRDFDERIVTAFYDDMSAKVRDSWTTRETSIPLPGKEDGFTRIQLIGTTGAGKTTLLRQLIGTDPHRERFPSTSPAKTTICDIEVISKNVSRDYRAAISFISRDLTSEHIEDNVKAAIMAAVENRPESEIRRKFLTHVEQRFRLNYILGSISEVQEDDDLDDEDEEENNGAHPKSLVSEEERVENSDRLLKWIADIKVIAESHRISSERDLEIQLETATNDEKEFVLEWIEESLSDSEKFKQLMDDVFDEIERRFDLLGKGKLIRDSSGWPQSWVFETLERAVFIDEVNRFSSNWAPNFGKLLTPLVDGIRVCGQFFPDWATGLPPKFVFLDGEGLGHTLDSASSVSTRITKRYEMVDAIVLVDSAAQPMQAAPFEVLKSIVASGNERKLAVCFTHFDNVKGDNISGVSSKRAHVLSSLENAVAAVGSQLGRLVENALRKSVENRVFFLSNIQKTLGPRAKATIPELNRLIETLSEKPLSISVGDVRPIFDSSNLAFVVQKALKDFHQPWMARLGFSFDADYPKQHWTRSKALSRRLGVLGIDEYDNLRPVADLIKCIADNLVTYTSNPLEWEPHNNVPEDIRIEICSTIARDLYTKIQELSTRRIFAEKSTEWRDAYFFSGRGSAAERADKIRTIFENGAPVPGTRAELSTAEFLKEIKRIVAEAVELVGGRIE